MVADMAMGYHQPAKTPVIVEQEGTDFVSLHNSYRAQDRRIRLTTKD